MVALGVAWLAVAARELDAAPANGAPYGFRVRVNSQFDARSFETEAAPEVDTLLIRRLSVSMEGAWGRTLVARFMPDLAAAKTSIPEAYVAWRPVAAFNVLVGKTKSPFDLERLVPQTDLLFVERAWPTSLAANRDAGVQVFGESGVVSYQFGWLNGARDNDSTTQVKFPLREVVARVMVHPFRSAPNSRWRPLAVGLAASHGEKHRVRPNGVRTHGQQRFFAWRGSVENDGDHVRVEPQAAFHRGPFGVLGSWIVSRQSLVNAATARPREVDLRAWYLAVHWVVTGEPATYRDGVAPAKPFRWDGDSWGALELAARLDRFEADAQAFPVFADPGLAARRARAATVGMNWHLHPRAKVSLNLEHTTFDGGERGVARTDERALLTRVQLRY